MKTQSFSYKSKFTLSYDPEVDTYGSRTLETKSGRLITFEEAFHDAEYVEKALEPKSTNVPKEFTMFVLRKMAVHEKDFRSFQEALPKEALEYLLKLFGIGSNIYKISQAHPANNEYPPSTFRAAFTQIFCRKVICNATNQVDEHFDKLPTVFPFKVSSDVRWYEMKILQIFDDEFYHEIQIFLDEHFDNVDALETVELFLFNIREFISNTFPAESLLSRLENPGKLHDDYLSTFPRLHNQGIDRFRFMYREFLEAMKSYGIRVPTFYRRYDEDYFRELPERNFADLYSFLDTDFLKYNREIYVLRIVKYLFFFVHALAVDSNPVFFIDDMLFECLKSLRKYKTLKEDISIKTDLAMIAMLHFRMNLSKRCGSFGNYLLSDTGLERMKKYLLKSIASRNPRLDVKYKTDLLASMSIRTDEAFIKICYNKRAGIKDFLECLLRSVLCPQDERVKCIIGYNAFLGKVFQFDLPDDIEFAKNFIRLCNTYDVSHEPLEESNLDVYILSLYLPFIETERVPLTIDFE